MKALKFLVFNQLIKAQQVALNSLLSGVSKRLRSMVSELLYTLSVFVPWIIPVGIIHQILKPAISMGQPYRGYFGPIDLLLNILASILVIGLLNKDFFNGQSVVKRQNGFQVVDFNTLQPASKFRCLLRNVTAPIWPIEVVFTLMNPQRRLGDFIAGTKLAETNVTDPERILDEIRGVTFDRQTTLIFGISILIVIGYTVRFW